MTQPSLRPQDVVVLAKLLSYEGTRPSMAQVGIDLSLSSSEVHAALNRLEAARLIANRDSDHRPLLAAVEEFLIHGVKYMFPAKRGEMTRGMLTSHAAPPLNVDIANNAEPPPVWPDPHGAHRGVSLEPLYKTVPTAARRDPFFYEILALLDALRDGRSREKRIAEKKLISRIHRHANARSKP